MLLLADYLKNPGKTPITNPAIWIQEDTIRFVGPRKALPSQAKVDPEIYEIRKGALFPGLVNAHCHLELSHLENLPYPGDFVNWIRQVLVWKYKDQGEAPSRAMNRGILQSLLGGVTTVADHMSCDGDLETLLASPLRGRIFIEVLGVVPEVAKDIFESSLALAQDLRERTGRFQIHPSPHSIHALAPDVLTKLFGQDYQMFSIHLGESQVEQEYFNEAKGPLNDLIRERGSPLKPQAPSALQVLEKKQVLDDRVLAIHGNYFSEAELKLCGKRGVSIVHCPLSHRYFGHKPFSLKTALEAGVNVALGTDSLASASSLSMLEVLRAARQNFPKLKLEEIFAMATVGGARALKMSDQIGDIAEGKKADLIGIRVSKNNDPLKELFGANMVEFSMVGGNMLIG